ncbi:MAG: hypothetical protein CFE23_06075 [Flavobacterium sp. BFFFF1]|uniref:hypothetical protein n=1 Tax=Flavobacterium sp. BFFFF1 TaxID=2015557 RepID=UPI000BC89CEF|nr:hypothetical protein [Flavobacterium sp. BFFFF1]OYU81059.1 MAG: hypothetical protein CFE23_06075 [Flavobacterium sp. BFFFF1]
MQQPWIHKAKTDGIFILAPSFLVLGIVFVFQSHLEALQERYPFYTWLFLIVFIDVAHVYATLFKTYFKTQEFQKRKTLLTLLPVGCFVIGMTLFAFGSAVFWRVLAYIAVFHFIRQQYGFMRLYSRKELKTPRSIFIDNLIIYSATGYPMLFWFLSPARKFNWFTTDDFFSYENAATLNVLQWIYFAIMGFYVLRTLHKYVTEKYFNIPKNAIIIGTALSWYFGIVYFNDDLIFTLLNVVSHGIPYMALIYLKEIHTKPEPELGRLHFLKAFRGIFIYIGILLIIAFSEEYLWEILVWNEQFSVLSPGMGKYAFLLVPLLTVPQFTHYILDGLIWKTKK